jgi:hypothetical protein
MAAGMRNQMPLVLMSAKVLPDIDQEKHPMARREALELVLAYYRITDRALAS